MNNNVKYYIITLKNIFLDNSKTDIHFGIYEDGKYYDFVGMNFPFYQELLSAPHGSAIRYISQNDE